MTAVQPRTSRWYLPSRRWLQFRLRTALVLMLLASFPLGWLGTKLAHKRAERKLVASIRAHGGYVFYDNSRGRVNRVPFAFDWLAHLLGEPELFENVIEVDLGRDRYGVIPPRVSPVPIGEFARHCPGIHTLGIYDARLDENDLRGLARLAKLENLNLGGCRFRDAGVFRICSLPNLKRLSLDYSDISDAELYEFRHLRNLCELRIYGNYVTDWGLKRFRAARPDVRVYGPLHSAHAGDN